MLCDTGPIVAMLVQSDPSHARCLTLIQSLAKEPLMTTWACLTESMHLLKRAGGWFAQEKLWRLLELGKLEVHQIPASMHPRLFQLMRKYHDAPMDVADATLVAAAEDLNERRVFTLDSHFHIYLINDQTPFDVFQ